MSHLTKILLTALALCLGVILTLAVAANAAERTAQPRDLAGSGEPTATQARAIPSTTRIVKGTAQRVSGADMF